MRASGNLSKRLERQARSSCSHTGKASGQRQERACQRSVLPMCVRADVPIGASLMAHGLKVDPRLVLCPPASPSDHHPATSLFGPLYRGVGPSISTVHQKEGPASRLLAMN